MPAATFVRTDGPIKTGFVEGVTAPPAQAPATAAPQPPQMPQEAAREAPAASLEVVLPDGRVVILARPEVACQFMVYRILGGVCPDGNVPSGLNVTVKSLMYVQSISGVKQVRPYDHVQAQAMMNLLGDEGTEIVAGAYLQHFLLQKQNLPLSGR